MFVTGTVLWDAVEEHWVIHREVSLIFWHPNTCGMTKTSFKHVNTAHSITIQHKTPPEGRTGCRAVVLYSMANMEVVVMFWLNGCIG